ANGTAALYSAMLMLGVGPGDEVITPAWNWICSSAPAPMLGAAPVFCDVDSETGLLDPADLSRRITPRTKAIIAVHLWGWPCDLDAIMAVSREAGVAVIEDCSHAHGATYRGKPVGTFGRVACWSLQGSKPVSAGEGGVLATDDTGVFERACLAGQVNRLAGIDLETPDYERFQPYGTGMKFRAHPLGIGIAAVQLRKLGALNAGRTAWVEAVEAGIRDIPFLAPLRVPDGGRRGGFYGFPVRLLPERVGGITAGEFIAALRAEGVQASANAYPLLHRLPVFAEGGELYPAGRAPLRAGWRTPEPLPRAEALIPHVVFLPVLTDPVPEALSWMLARIHRAAAKVALPPSGR
ncbi:MAG: DegT/DnrJ/EryC1/StrS family aminotransferase, partial [bacterium]